MRVYVVQIVSVFLVQTCLCVFVYMHPCHTCVPVWAHKRTHLRLIDRKLENNSDSLFGFRPWPLRKPAGIADKVNTKSVSIMKPRSYRDVVFLVTSFPVVTYPLFLFYFVLVFYVFLPFYDSFITLLSNYCFFLSLMIWKSKNRKGEISQLHSDKEWKRVFCN